MTLEFEKLGPTLEDMAEAVARLRALQRERSRLLRDVLATRASDWAAIEAGLARAQEQQAADPKYFRAARPFDDRHPINAAIPAPPPPDRATIIATDGSQIMPDRHAAFLYYLINIGAITYFHGDSVAPETGSFAHVFYPTPNDEDRTEDEPGFNKSEVAIARDMREIETLARLAAHRQGSPHLTLAVLDQRLLYWPFSGERDKTEGAVKHWTSMMTALQASGALLAGYIDRPGKRSVITLLETLLPEAAVDWKSLGKRPSGAELTDAMLYAHLLGPGERSPVFIDISPANQRFTEIDANNEVCFFYLNPGLTNLITEDGDEPLPQARAIARVDIPRWVAESDLFVAAVHGLIYDQCRLVGDYPYVLVRADELAVVGRQDESDFNQMIDLTMQRLGIMSAETSKAQSKDLARAAPTRHMIR